MEMPELITAIEQADGYIIDEIISALQRRCRNLYPDEEIIYLSLPRHDHKERRRILESILRMEL